MAHPEVRYGLTAMDIDIGMDGTGICGHGGTARAARAFERGGASRTAAGEN
ncbi:hypothetical protein [Catenulispora rubra]|uniref:hypothetical protein n=1 Tax=Catenulispora rubra TaxID=280293 RepID=UPI0018920848|nr:hypothetical protein [Catenulispora rubra]